MTTATAWAGPRMEFQEREHHFGRVVQGKVMDYRFYFTNVGDADLAISEVTTPCGCTAVLAGQDVIPPGGQSFIDVSYDSAARSGEVTRVITVHSNDSEEPELELKVVAQVDASMHEGFKVGETLFGPKCAECHVDPTVGKLGQELYDASCWFCHGRQRQGKTAPALGAYPPESAGFLRDMITSGRLGTEMPGFGKAQGGPLSAEQIESLLPVLYTTPPPAPPEEESEKAEPSPTLPEGTSSAAPKPFFQ
ncbi:MAG: DUF1573 domain-containing protein [Nitrospirota bacterium]|nr:DUF1573 domain-containing protein [Nitrospirota bacterium]